MAGPPFQGAGWPPNAAPEVRMVSFGVAARSSPGAYVGSASRPTSIQSLGLRKRTATPRSAVGRVGEAITSSADHGRRFSRAQSRGSWEISVWRWAGMSGRAILLVTVAIT